VKYINKFRSKVETESIEFNVKYINQYRSKAQTESLAFNGKYIVNRTAQRRGLDN
jgi:hypothetical protein